jgi:membrane protease YdiL (CAAX protease family)
MATDTIKLSLAASRVKTDQFPLWKILLMFAWPAMWYIFLIYIIGRAFIPSGGFIPTWYRLLVMVLGPAAELTAGLLLLRGEGYRLTLASLRDRLRLRWPRGGKAWAVAVVVLVLGLALSMAMGPLNGWLAAVPGFAPPAWWGPANNPTAQVTGAADFFPDINLAGNYLFLFVYFAIGLLFNVIGEELYYRGYLLPHMHGVFGRLDWVANGLLFTLKHVYQRWLYPGILVGGLSFAFAAGPLGSLPLAMVYHWVGNYLFQMVLLARAVIGL